VVEPSPVSRGKEPPGGKRGKLERARGRVLKFYSTLGWARREVDQEMKGRNVRGLLSEAGRLQLTKTYKAAFHL